VLTIKNGELGMIQEVVVAHLKILSWYLQKKIRKAMKTLARVANALSKI
jgi:hypothetical protein